MTRLRRSVLVGTLASTLAGALLATSAPALAASTAVRPTHPTTGFQAAAPINYHAWTSLADWHSGTADGVTAVPGWRAGVVVGTPAGTTSYTDPHTGTTKNWEYATWTSPGYGLRFPATELVSSWNADTPAGSWIQVQMQGRYSNGGSTPWYVMGRWASGDGDIVRTSVDGQADQLSNISTDTWSMDSAAAAKGLGITSYQLRVTLYRTPGSTVTPRVYRLGAFASNVPPRFDVPASTPGLRNGVELKVPRYSQDIHAGQYPQYDGGGEAWCSPTSTEMVVEYWGHKPTAQQLSWVDPSYADPSVDYAARYTYDAQFSGTGNWPFNAAYAASYGGMDAIITQLHSMNDVEKLVSHGIPVVASVSFYASELDGAGYSTAGHLMTVVGFTPSGDVIVNDPASPNDPAVRHVYKRHQLETIWFRTERHLSNGSIGSGTGGVSYVYKPFWLPWPSGLNGSLG